MNVANSVTYLSQDFKLQGSKVRNGGADFNGQGVVWCAVLVEGAGNLIEVATDFSVFGGQPANGGQQFIIDRGNGNDGGNGGRCNGWREKSGWARDIVFLPLGRGGGSSPGGGGCGQGGGGGGFVFFFQQWTPFSPDRAHEQGLGKALPNKIYQRGKIRRYADFGTVVESCSKNYRFPRRLWFADILACSTNIAIAAACSARCSPLQR